jgi:RNA 2',3'-cyclic 3'-phosphodiesterase
VSSGRVRLFAALDLPGDVRAELGDWARGEFGSREELRLVPEENLHATLCFLGWREEGEVERIGELVEACTGAVGDLAWAGATWLPPRRPRVLAVDLVDEGRGLRALQQRVSDALAEGAGYVPEKRPYRPHVTVARVRKGARVPRSESLPALAPRGWSGGALTLYRSLLSPSGARYEPVARVAV